MSQRLALFLKANVRAYTRQDGTAVAAHHRADAPVMSFNSGASSLGIMRGYIMAGSPLGVALTEMSPGSAPWDAMIGYAQRGGRVFVDSGAFPAFMAGKPVDWQRSMRMVRQLIAESPGARFHIVMPDIIGDQAASLALLREHAGYVRDVIGAGHDALVPIQKGALSPHDAWSEAVRIIGTSDFTASVPSNRAAFTLDDLRDLMRGPHHPPRIHFLGIAGNKKRLAELVAVVHAASPQTIVTSDANRLRAKVGQGRPITAGKARLGPQIDAQFRWLLAQDHPALVAAWDQQGAKAVAPAATSLAILEDETRGRAQTDLFAGLR